MIGNLRTRVGIYHAVTAPDDLGGAVTTWPLLKAVWADIKLQTPRETSRQGRSALTVNYRVVMRFIDNFPERARLMWGGHTLRVVAASDPDGRRERLNLMCEEERQ